MGAPERKTKLGRVIHNARTAKGLSGYEVAKRLGHIHRSTIAKIESGRLKNPNTQTLRGLAGELDLDLSYLFVLAGHPVPNELPDFEPYLRAKHGHLSEAAIAKLTKQFERINQTMRRKKGGAS